MLVWQHAFVCVDDRVIKTSEAGPLLGSVCAEFWSVDTLANTTLRARQPSGCKVQCFRSLDATQFGKGILASENVF